MPVWSARLRAEHEAVIDRMKERKKRRAQLGDRKSAAAQNRMKSLASLAADTNGGKKRKKGDEEKDDGFGRDDSDWAVYRELVSKRFMAFLTLAGRRRGLGC